MDWYTSINIIRYGSRNACWLLSLYSETCYRVLWEKMNFVILFLCFGDFTPLSMLNIASGSISKDPAYRKASDRHRYLVLMLTLTFTQRLPYFSQCNRKVKMGGLFETHTLWSLMDVPLRLLNFRKFSTQDILIPFLLILVTSSKQDKSYTTKFYEPS